MNFEDIHPSQYEKLSADEFINLIRTEGADLGVHLEKIKSLKPLVRCLRRSPSLFRAMTNEIKAYVPNAYTKAAIKMVVFDQLDEIEGKGNCIDCCGRETNPCTITSHIISTFTESEFEVLKFAGHSPFNRNPEPATEIEHLQNQISNECSTGLNPFLMYRMIFFRIKIPEPAFIKKHNNVIISQTFTDYSGFEFGFLSDKYDLYKHLKDDEMQIDWWVFDWFFGIVTQTSMRLIYNGIFREIYDLSHEVVHNVMHFCAAIKRQKLNTRLAIDTAARFNNPAVLLKFDITKGEKMVFPDEHVEQNKRIEEIKAKFRNDDIRRRFCIELLLEAMSNKIFLDDGVYKFAYIYNDEGDKIKYHRPIWSKQNHRYMTDKFFNDQVVTVLAMSKFRWLNFPIIKDVIVEHIICYMFFNFVESSEKCLS